ncbi:4a-hydroxytetrahydrobiopterin dehydratase [Actinosynnema sp. NPDC020468]|uniref:4a-hydroxytetrahydrobiopterin dehydratase n=1 Tax=Actinosynnema sp. NPDC020468 TaxID=3154488 RepID=UPI0033DDAF89
MAELLTDDQITEALSHLAGWTAQDASLVRTAELAGFREAIAVVNAVAEVAESSDHHPDIDIRWNTLTFRCSTHSAGGITTLDVSLAQEIDRLLDA